MSYRAFRIVSWAVVAVVAWVLLGVVARSLGYFGFGFSEFLTLLVLGVLGGTAFLVARVLWRLGTPPR